MVLCPLASGKAGCKIGYSRKKTPSPRGFETSGFLTSRNFHPVVVDENIRQT